MKYSFMSFSCPDLDIKSIMYIAKMYGYDGFEPRIDAGHKHGLETNSNMRLLKEAKEISEESNIKICCIATSCRFADLSLQSENIESAKLAIDLSKELDSPCIRVFGGTIPDNVTRDESKENIKEALSKLSKYAQERNVTVCIETHDDWCDPDLVANIVSNINSPWIAVNWDIMHPVITSGYSVERSFDILKPYIQHVHVHDGQINEKRLEFKAIGSGKVDHLSAIKLLRDSGYKGYLSGEWINWEPYVVHLQRELNKMKSYENG